MQQVAYECVRAQPVSTCRTSRNCLTTMCTNVTICRSYDAAMAMTRIDLSKIKHRPCDLLQPVKPLPVNNTKRNLANAFDNGPPGGHNESNRQRQDQRQRQPRQQQPRQQQQQQRGPSPLLRLLSYQDYHKGYLPN